MTRRQGVDLTARVLAHMDADTLDIADGVWSESREAFISPERLEADRALFRRVPHVIGWSGEVAAPGSYTTKDVMGVPIIVSRTRAGELKAFVNGCAHRGAQVAEGCGEIQRFQCPYHGWTYALDGRLTGAPARRMFDGVDLKQRGLLALPVSDRGGLITVGLSAEVDVDGALDDVVEELDEYDFANHHHYETRRFDLRTNWKLAVDVNFEGYHFPYTHSNTIDAFVTNNSAIDTYGRHARWAFPFRDLDQYRDVPPEQWPDQFHGTVVYGLFPSCVLVESPGLTQMIRVYPGAAPGECVVYVTYGSTTPIREEDLEMHAGGMEAACMVLADEDFPAAEACQRGIEAGVDNLLFGRNEPLLHHFASAWQQALLDEDAVGQPASTRP